MEVSCPPLFLLIVDTDTFYVLLLTRNIAMRKAEKEQEKKDRDKIRQKLQQDKVML